MSSTRLFALAVGLSATTFALRWWLGSFLGFADAEALYAAYARHPQPAYLDHPGLVGSVMRLLGQGTAPSPSVAHRFAAIVATATPWLGGLAARASGADTRGALRTCLALALVPEITVGLFSVSPDLLLAPLWLLGLAAVCWSLRSQPGSSRALVGFLLAGAFVGLATIAKVTGILLGVAFVAAMFGRPGRTHLGTVAPWAGALVAALLVSPVVLWEVRHGFPMLAHRLVATQTEAGLSLRNLGALIGGQLVYVTPPFLAGATLVHRSLRRVRDQPVAGLLLHATWWPAAPLVALCLWSRVAEPHWLAPAYLGLAVGLSHVKLGARWIHRTAAGLGVAVIALSAAWVGTPLAPRFLGSGYRPRYDLANDLHVWTGAGSALEDFVDAFRGADGMRPILVGPHWIVCAQAAAALGAGARVGCLTPEGDDFQHWFPQSQWRRATPLVFVSDDRFDIDAGEAFPNRRLVAERKHVVRRGGVAVRTLTFSVLARHGTAGRRVLGDPNRRAASAGLRSRTQK